MKIVRPGILCALISFMLTSCHVGRYFHWNLADVNDYRRFPADSVKKGPQTFSFNIAPGNISLTLAKDYNKKGKLTSFEDFLKHEKTTAFLIIRNDSIIYEKYFYGNNENSVLPSFSVAKSFVSALAGIAVAEGYIKSVDDPVTDYVKGFKHEGFDKVTLRHLLDMRSGVRFNEGYVNPFGHMAKFYYGTHLDKYTLKLKIREAPGLHYDYISGNTQILAMALENSTGKTLPVYLQEKIWIPLGMEKDASWNYDSRKHHRTKSFCCINATARDFAKFGRLYLKKGNWQGKQLIPESWMKQNFTITHDSRDSQGYPYEMHWRVKTDGSIFAKGILGQYIYVDPEKDLLILRFGKKAGKTNWPALFETIAREVSREKQ
ncbi:MAG: beta-lactamase family protein [Bacteroidetes bacterium]|nr:beta-lactamase family protein [Bacteroidota bacterium]